jgi:hypothetical protein
MAGACRHSAFCLVRQINCGRMRALAMQFRLKSRKGALILTRDLHQGSAARPRRA